MEVKLRCVFVGLVLAAVAISGLACCGAWSSLEAKIRTSQAERHLEEGEYEEAVEDYDRALAADPEDIKNWCNRGYALARLGEYEKAIASFESALALDPGNAWAWCVKGITLGVLGEYDQALGCIDRALALNPEYVGAWMAKGDIYKRVGAYKKALACFERVIKINPDEKDAWVRRSEAYRLMGNYREAVKCLNHVLAMDPDYVPALGIKGIFLLDKGQYETASECFSRVLESDREERSAWYYKGLALFLQRKYSSAAEHFETAVEVDPLVVTRADLYYYISYYISKARVGRGGSEILKPALNGDCREWPYPGVRFFTGEITAGQLLAAAGDDRWAQSEAHCFIGYKDKFRGDATKAYYHFAAAVKAGEKAGVYATFTAAYLMAKHELGR